MAKIMTIRINPNKIKVRKMWIINPVTRVVPNKKAYNRREVKKETRKILKEEL